MSVNITRPSSYDNFFGIFVGVEKFPSSKGEIPSLMHTNEDADKMCEIFLAERRDAPQKYDLCLLVNKGYQVAYEHEVAVHAATRSNIYRELTRCLKAAKANDFLLVYISSHGIIDFDDYFFLPSDGEMDNVLGTGIAVSTVVGAIGKATGRGVKAWWYNEFCVKKGSPVS